MTTDLPPINVSKLSENDAICYRIGEYIKAFSEAEHILSVLGSVALGIDIKKIQFLWRDLGIKAKTTILRRVAVECLGRASKEFTTFNKLLNELDSAVQFRNDLAHGTFVGGKGHGRIGQSLSELFDGFKPLRPDAILEQTQRVSDIGLRLAKSMPIFLQATSKKRSASTRGS